MENPWKEFKVEDKSGQRPDSVIVNFFSPLSEKTNYKIQVVAERVNSFPEEVVPKPGSIWQEVLMGQIQSEDHPEYGYDIHSAINDKELRYRILLKVSTSDGEGIEYELLKIKYPLKLYPV
jgi:hypothetical protein